MKRLSTVLLVGLCTLFCCLTAKGAPLDDRVPADAVLYVGWQGADALAAQYDKSNLKGVIEASSIREFIRTGLPKLIDQAAARDPNAPKSIAKLQTGLGIAWHHPAAFYFCPLDFSNPRQPQLQFGLICDAGADATALSNLLKEGLAQIPPNPELPVAVVTDSTSVLLSFGKPMAPAYVRKGAGLVTNPAYIKAMSTLQFRGTAAIASYVDIQKLLANVSDGLAKSPEVPPDAKAKFSQVVDLLGVKSLTQIATVGGFNNKNWSERGFVGISGPRKGMLMLADAPALSDEVFGIVPKDAAAFTAGSLDINKIYAETRNIIGQIDATILPQMDRTIALANSMIGIDIEKDLIASLGSEWVYYRAPAADESGLSMALVHKLKDGPTFARALATLEQLFNDRSGSPIKVEKVTSGKISVSAVMIPPGYSVAWTVRGNYLYVSTMAGISGVVAQVEEKGELIIASPAYKTAMAALPQGNKPSSVDFSSPARLYPQIRQLALSVLPLARAQGIDIPLDLLPDPTAIKEFLPPGASTSWSDASGLHFASDSAFPGAAMLGGQQLGSVAVALMGVAVLLPSLGRARELSNRTVDAANLRGIAQACAVWSADHNAQMPDDLARLVAENLITTRQLADRRAGTVAVAMTPELMQQAKTDFVKFAQTVNDHCDYVYLGKGTKSETDPSVIVVYERPGSWSLDGINVAFQDGHAEFASWQRVPALFEPTNAFLKKAGLPAVDVQALLRASPNGVPRGALPANELP